MATLASRWPEPIAQQPVARLPWGHITVILDKCRTVEISEFYARRAAEEGWTRGVLQAMIANRLHERSQPALTNFDRSVPEPDREAVREIVKDPFILDFLAADPVRERDLSKALTDNLARSYANLVPDSPSSAPKSRSSPASASSSSTCSSTTASCTGTW